MASAGSIFVDLNLKDALFRQGLNRAKNDTKSATKSMSSDFNALSGVAKAAFAGLAAGITFKRFIDNTIIAEQQQAQLRAALEATGYAAGYTQRQLNAMAASLSERSIFSSGEINSAQTRLLSYVGILGENLPRAMQAVIDQSARLGISVEQSAETIGRALEQPSKAAAALSRQGFGSYFTKDVIEMLKALEQQGKVAEAQVKILEVLEESYAGAAAAARDTLGGALTNLNNTINDLLTSDSAGVNGLTNAINWLSDSLKFASENGFFFEQAIAGIVATVYEAGIALTEMRLKVLNATNAFGIRDDKISKRTEELRQLKMTLDALGMNLNDEFSASPSVDFSKPSLSGLPSPAPYESEESIKKRNKALDELNRLYERHEAIIRGVSEETIRLESVERDLDTLRQAGKITVEQMEDALGRYKDSLNKTGNQMDEFAKQAARNIQDSFANFLFDPFEDGLRGMLKGFVDTLRQMIAQAAAARLSDYLLGDGTGASGKVGVLKGPLEDLFGGLFADGGTLGAGKWGIVGEEGPEIAFGGLSGKSIINQEQFASATGGRGNTYNIDARGADQGAVARMEQALISLAGPGVVEKRIGDAQLRGSL